jgi:hypothetical protein
MSLFCVLQQYSQANNNNQVTFSQENGNALNGLLLANVDESMRLGALKQYNRDPPELQPSLTQLNVVKLTEMIRYEAEEVDFDNMKVIAQTLGDVGQDRSNVMLLAENGAYKELAQVNCQNNVIYVPSAQQPYIC